MKRLIQSILLQIQFFTRIPLPISVPYSESHFIRGIIWYPVIAMAIGAGLGGLLDLFRLHNYDVLGIAVLLILSTGVYGILHLDGLADTADGFFSGKDRNRTLEIMRDSRIGTNGAVGLILFFVVKISLLLTLQHSLVAMAFAALGSRFSMIALAGIGTYARSDSGLGGGVITGANIWTIVRSCLISLAAALAFFPSFWIVICVIFLVSLLLSVAMNRFSHKKIGGITGDVLGAHVELSELIFLLICVIAENGGWL